MSGAQTSLAPPETVRAAGRVVRKLEWTEGFWLGYVFTNDPAQSSHVRERAAATLRARDEELRYVQPDTPAQLQRALETILSRSPVGFTWVEAIREPDALDGSWTRAWLQLILRSNERRELLRRRLTGGLMFVMHPDLKAEVRAAGPDLWSIHSVMLELAPGPASSGSRAASADPEHGLALGAPILGPSPIPPPTRFVNVALLDRDLARWPALAKDMASEPRAEMLLALAERSSAAQRDAEALRLSAAAVHDYRALAGAEPERHRLGLARALMLEARQLVTLSRGQQALALALEAVELHRLHRDQDPEAPSAPLAGALAELGTCASIAREHDLARDSLREAIALFERSAPDEERISLLISLSATLLDAGRAREALEVSEQALALSRALARSNPDAFGPVLAGTLNNVAFCLGALGRPAEALELMAEALSLSRELAAQDPGRWREDLARSLYNFGVQAGRIGRLDEAIAATGEAVETLTELVDAGAEFLLPQLAPTLTGHSVNLREAGRHDEARAVSTRAIEILRELAGGQPKQFNPTLAIALNDHGLLVSGQAAAAAFREAVELLRPFALPGARTTRSMLATLLSNESGALARLGRQDEALAVSEEAIGLLRELAQDPDPNETRSLAGALNNLSVRLAERGREDEALACSSESVELLERLSRDGHQAELTPLLASALMNLALRLSARDDHEQAVATANRAVALRREQAASRPAALASELAPALVNLGAVLSDAGQPEAARVHTREAVDLYRDQRERGDDVADELGKALHNLARALMLAQEWDELSVVATEALAQRRTAASQGPEQRHGLAQTLALLAAAEEHHGHDERALATYDEALELLGPEAKDDPLYRALRDGKNAARERLEPDVDQG